MNGLTAFTLWTFVCFIILIFFVISNENSIIPKIYQKCEAKCSVNDGINYVNKIKCKCLNGARFNIEEIK